MRALLIMLLSAILCTMSTLSSAEDAPSTAFTLTTDAFLDTGPIPVLYTCDGKDLSPKLDWTNVPAKTKTMALLITDPTAPDGVFYHWVLSNIPTTVTGLEQGTTTPPAGIVKGKNSFNKDAYNGPCPPKGAAHTYLITLYALDNKLTLSGNATGAQVTKAMSKHVLGKAELTMVYSRWLK
jgi:Raf kinase inhibitor-like YbhB/YbcL family protein